MVKTEKVLYTHGMVMVSLFAHHNLQIAVQDFLASPFLALHSLFTVGGLCVQLLLAFHI